jgi:hypothetical protein
MRDRLFAQRDRGDARLEAGSLHSFTNLWGTGALILVASEGLSTVWKLLFTLDVHSQNKTINLDYKILIMANCSSDIKHPMRSSRVT